MRFEKKLIVLAMTCSLATICTNYALADNHKKNTTETTKPWTNTSLTADERASLLVKEMTLDEKLVLVFGYFGTDAAWQNNYKRPKESLAYSAGYVYGVPRLGIPEQFETDAGMGVATQGGPMPRVRTSLPSGINVAASWNLETAYNGGAMIGSEARMSGFNVMLAGGVNIMREPRNGRNFEYAGEDPLLSGHIVGQAIKGIQSNKIISTLKHFAFNNQETGRFGINAVVEESAARMSDLLALQIANEVGQPGSVMCSYNRVNGYYGCESDFLLNTVLKKDWGFKGYVMSDWGATHSTIPAANNGLDQQSGYSFDLSPYFAGALKEAVLHKWVPQERMDDMAHRILRSFINAGVFENPVSDQNTKIDYKANGLVSQTASEEGMVLLKNANNILPLSKDAKKIVVIGSHADVGVLSGGGSSQVYGTADAVVKGIGPNTFPGPLTYHPSAPLKAIKARATQATITYDEGTDIKAAAKLAKGADVVVVFVNQWTGESVDATSLSLPDNQDALVAAIAKANPKTVVVLENGGPVLMPWLNKVAGVLEAWYPGTSGGEAIGRVLFGEVNPSGHLPATFPASEKQLPRPVVDGDVKNDRLLSDVNYFEGAAVGYKWFDLKGLKPLFPFGYGLSYTQFAYSDLSSEFKDGKLTVNFKMSNTGAVKGKDVAQVYVSPVKGGWEAPKRLGGWSKLELNPGETKATSVTVEPRILGVYNVATKTWDIAEGDYTIILAQDAADSKASSVKVHLPAFKLDVNGKAIK